MCLCYVDILEMMHYELTIFWQEGKQIKTT